MPERFDVRDILPRITLVTPSFNQGRYLEQALRSVLNQGYPPLEYIVMDGGSTDGSVEIILRYADQLAHWESAKDAGQADAIHRGFEKATGEVLGWLNSDDFLLPGALMKVGRYFAAHPEVDCAVGGSLLVDEEGDIAPTRKGRPPFDLGTRQDFRKLLLWECGGFTQPASFWRREAFLAVGGFDTSLKFCFDYDMYLRLAQRKSFGRIPAFLASFRRHPFSKSSTLSEVCAREKEEVRRRHGLGEIPVWERYLARRLYVLGESARRDRLRLLRRLGILKLPVLAGWPPPPEGAEGKERRP